MIDSSVIWQHYFNFRCYTALKIWGRQSSRMASRQGHRNRPSWQSGRSCGQLLRFLPWKWRIHWPLFASAECWNPLHITFSHNMWMRKRRISWPEVINLCCMFCIFMTALQPQLLLCLYSMATGVLGGQQRSRVFNSFLYLKQCRLTTNKQIIARTQSQTHTAECCQRNNSMQHCPSCQLMVVHLVTSTKYLPKANYGVHKRDFRLPPRNGWEMRSSVLLLSE